MKREILWDPAAWADVEEALGDYAEHSPTAAVAFRDEVSEAVERIAGGGEDHPVFDDGARRCLLKSHPFGLLYALDDEHVAILAVMRTNRRAG